MKLRTGIETHIIVDHGPVGNLVHEVVCRHLEEAKAEMERNGMSVRIKNEMSTESLDTNLITGMVFDIKGFDEVARVSYAEGHGCVIVAHNNSSYIHVGDQFLPDGDVVLVASYPYYEREDDYPKAYRAALDFAAQLASRR